MIDILKGKKTYLVAAASIAYAWLGVYFGSVDINTAIQLTLAALGGSAIRNAIPGK
jgi:hypothetical protein